jgi:hemerythrin-like domain-containing protein
MTGPPASGPPSRRAVLLTVGGLAAAGGGFAAGSGVALAVNSGAAPDSIEILRIPTPGEDLMAEHGLLVRILLIYRHMLAGRASGQPVPAGHAHDSALIIHDYIEAFHEELEEAFVFRRLMQAGQLKPTISTLVLQHARGRELTQLILAESGGSGSLPTTAADRVASAMAGFVRMYEPHEAREDTVVYPAFRALLKPAEIADLSERFADLQTEQFGRDGFAAMVGQVATIEEALGIYDLGQFTPPKTTPSRRLSPLHQ